MATRTIALITGGNNGIGYEAVKALLQSTKPYHVLMGSRSIEKGKLAVEKLQQECPGLTNTVEIVQVDISNDKSIEKAYEQVKSGVGHIDVLINNAAIAPQASPDISLRELFMSAYDVNLAGTHVMSYTFMPLLLKSSNPRLIFVSGLANITIAAEEYFPTPPVPAGWPKKIDFETIPYRCSKVALHMLMLDWNHKLKADGVKVWGVGPGFLETDLGGGREAVKKMGAGHASAGGNILRRVVEGERDADVGKLVVKDGLSAW